MKLLLRQRPRWNYLSVEFCRRNGYKSDRGSEVFAPQTEGEGIRKV